MEPFKKLGKKEEGLGKKKELLGGNKKLKAPNGGCHNRENIYIGSSKQSYKKRHTVRQTGEGEPLLCRFPKKEKATQRQEKTGDREAGGSPKNEFLVARKHTLREKKKIQ